MITDEHIEMAGEQPGHVDGAEPAAPPPEEERPRPPAVHDVRNCTNDNVIVHAGRRCFQLSPLAVSEVDDSAIAEFALGDLAAQRVTRITTRDEAAGGNESGVVFGVGFWAISGYFGVYSAIDAPTAKLVFAVVAPIAAIVIGLVVLAVLKKRLADVGQGLSLVLVFVIGAVDGQARLATVDQPVA